MTLYKNYDYFEDINNTVNLSGQEIKKGLEILHEVEQPLVSIFGSHATPVDSPTYNLARDTAKMLGESGRAVVTGGGPGIMQAANQGAKQAGADSIGFRAGLIKGEQVADDYCTKSMDFAFIFARRFCLGIKSTAMLFFPGGVGTLNELYEYLTLMQINIADNVPVILVDKQYWQGLFDWMDSKKSMDYPAMSLNNLKYLYFADTVDEIKEILNNH